jgi:hypothetical protein
LSIDDTLEQPVPGIEDRPLAGPGFDLPPVPPPPNVTKAPRKTPVDDDADAPWGRRPDGRPWTPYGVRKDGKPKLKGGRRRNPTLKPAAPKRRQQGTDYREAVLGMAQLVAAPLVMIGQQDGGEAFMADAVAIVEAAPPIASAVDDLARKHPGVAKVLDKVTEVGPYGALIGAVVPLVMQLAANHGVVKPELVGAKTIDELVPHEDAVAA